MTIYEIDVLSEAKKEWDKLDADIRERFKKKLFERLSNPRVPKDKLKWNKNRYKIKLSSIGYRLVYEVSDTQSIIMIVSVGRRDKSAVYKAADKR